MFGPYKKLFGKKEGEKEESLIRKGINYLFKPYKSLSNLRKEPEKVEQIIESPKPAKELVEKPLIFDDAKSKMLWKKK